MVKTRDKVLITGGAGFIGSHLSDALLRKGSEVYIIDDLSTGSEANIEHLKDNAHYHYVIDSILDRSILAHLIEKCDMVFHLAAAVGVKFVVENAVKTLETNIKGTENILELANIFRKKVVLFSTSEVYGKSVKIPFAETDNMVLGATSVGRWSYACSKAIDEFMGLAYQREKGLPVTIIRLFNIVGPRQSPEYGMVLPRFIQQALRNEPITVFDGGGQSRCFGHIHDVIDGIVGIADAEDAVGEVFNIGNDEEITILELAKKVKEITNSGSEIVSVSSQKYYGGNFEDMQRRVPDLKKINRYISYKPSRNIDCIISDMVDYMKHR